MKSRVLFTVAILIFSASSRLNSSSFHVSNPDGFEKVEGRINLDGSQATFTMSLSGIATVSVDAKRCGVALIPVAGVRGVMIFEKALRCSAGEQPMNGELLRSLSRLSFRAVKELSDDVYGHDDGADALGFSPEDDPESRSCCVSCGGFTICGGSVTMSCGSCSLVDFDDW
jgi:hypothetical protein